MDIATQYYATEGERPLKYYLIGLLLFFLPFMQALTVNLFFPLKVSEICLFLFFILYPLDVLLIPKKNLVLLVTSLLLLAFASTFINLFTTFPYPLDERFVRLSKEADSLLKFFYLLLAGLLLIILNKYFQNNGFEVLRFFFAGAIASAAYSWYLILSGLLNLPVLHLPGMEDQPQTITLSIGTFIRAGTFKEGNYMGLFLLLSAALAFHFQRQKTGIFLLLSIITTFSTTSFFCATFFVLYSTARRSLQRPSRLVMALLIVALVGGIVLSGNEAIRIIVLDKIFSGSETLDPNASFSRLDRLNSIQAGWNIFLNNPFFGVGPANYGLHFPQYNQFIQNIDIKFIPNNVYIELLSETGIFAALVFTIFIFLLIVRTRRLQNVYLQAGLLSMSLYLIAFPTYTSLFIWLFLAVVSSCTEPWHHPETVGGEGDE